MVRVFISDINGHIGKALKSAALEAEHEVVGTVEAGEDGGKVAETADVGTPEAEDLAFSADVVFVTLKDGLADADAVVRALRRALPEETQKLVIGISSVFTWAKTVSKSDDGKLSEDKYKSRKPAPKYTQWKTAESQIMNLAKEGLQSAIVSAGIVYGGGENLLHGIFKEAWICESAALQVPVAGSKKGGNALPMIHVKDLAKIAVSMVDNPPAKKYIVAVDQATSTLVEVAQALSTAMGPGPVEVLEGAAAEERLLTDASVTALQLDLQFDTEEATVAGFDFEWTAQAGFVENAAAVAAEFVAERNLRPVKVALLGPPASGKTTFANELATHYYVDRISAADCVEYAKGLDNELGTEVNTALEAAANGRLEHALFCKCVRAVLLAPKQRNRGWILDGLPRTYAEARAIFGEPSEEEDAGDAKDDAEDDTPIPVDAAAMPTAAVVLEADPELLAERIKALPQESVEGTHNTEDGFNRRLKAYQEANQPENPQATIVFLEKHGSLDTMTLTVDASTTAASAVDQMYPYVEAGGTPFNYHPTPEEIAEKEAAAAAAAAAEEEAAAKAEADRIEAETLAKEAREAEEKARLDEIGRQEAALLEARSAPLRGYLMDNVIPTLTQGLLEVCKVAPEDPVDYLAEFLFKHSTAGTAK